MRGRAPESPLTTMRRRPGCRDWKEQAYLMGHVIGQWLDIFEKGYRGAGMRDLCHRLLKAVLCTTLIGGMLAPACVLAAEDAGSYTLQQCIEKAVEASPEISSSRYEARVRDAKLKQAEAEDYPQMDVTAIAGPSPEARRSDFLRTDVSGNRINGVFGSVEVNLIQPLDVFGVLGGNREAAASGLKAAETGVDKKTSDIILKTKEFYYSLLLARDMKSLSLEIREIIVAALNKLRTRNAPADALNFLRLGAFLGEVGRHVNDADKDIEVSKAALLMDMGLPPDSEFTPAEASLTPEETMPAEINVYLKNAAEMRPEFIRLKAALDEKKALIKVGRSNYYPMAFIGFDGVLAGATNREKIDNPYLSDPLGYTHAAVFTGLKWSLDFGITKGRVREAEAEYNKLAEEMKLAEAEIPLQVRKAFFDMAAARKNIAEAEEACRNSRKWLDTASANLEAGLGDSRDMVEAAGLYLQNRTSKLRAAYNQRLAYANILYASGMDRKGLK